MDKREKVIRGLECCEKKVCIFKDTEKECPYWELCGEYESAFEDCTTALAKDALALLKAQEPVEPIYGEDNYIRCGKCKHHIVGIIAQDTGNRMPIQKYCAECGQAVKWDG